MKKASNHLLFLAFKHAFSLPTDLDTLSLPVDKYPPPHNFRPDPSFVKQDSVLAFHRRNLAIQAILAKSHSQYCILQAHTTSMDQNQEGSGINEPSALGSPP